MKSSSAVIPMLILERPSEIIGGLEGGQCDMEVAAACNVGGVGLLPNGRECQLNCSHAGSAHDWRPKLAAVMLLQGSPRNC